ncbi:MAG: lipoyl domain-containing protein [Pirellulales bacterium]|nr:lipoyl domain-containing protein [Pirellulales bacterium]
MRHQLVLPDLGLGELPITASLWLVEPGSRVTQGDRLLEVLADGVTVDLPSPVTGVLVDTLVSEDDRLEVGQPLAVLESTEP